MDIDTILKPFDDEQKSIRKFFLLFIYLLTSRLNFILYGYFYTFY